jgi:hypothetical protein
LVHFTQIKIPHSQLPHLHQTLYFLGGRAGQLLILTLRWSVNERAPCTIISADFLLTRFAEFLTIYFPRFFTWVHGGFPAQHFAQHSIHLRIFNELNNCLFNMNNLGVCNCVTYPAEVYGIMQCCGSGMFFADPRS